jgi:hypothetical protein
MFEIGYNPTMSIQPICDFCLKELEDFGGLIFSPPEQGHDQNKSDEQNVQKLHVCKTCYAGMLSMFMKKGLAPGEIDNPAKEAERTASAVAEIKPGIYKHSKKGDLYRVIGLAKHSETKEDLVVYEALYENEVSKLWVRPATMFTEKVLIDGSYVPRFTFVSATL